MSRRHGFICPRKHCQPDHPNCPRNTRVEQQAGEFDVIQFILHDKNHVVVGYLRLKDGWTQFAKRGEWGKELSWVYPCPFKWHHWHCDIIDRQASELAVAKERDTGHL